MHNTEQELVEEFDSLPKIDFHSHLDCQAPAATSVKDVVFYHMVAAELRACGLTMENMWGPKSYDRDWTELLSNSVEIFPRLRNSAIYRALFAIGSDLFEIKEAGINREFLFQLNDRINEEKESFGWADAVFERMNVEKSCAAIRYRSNTAESIQEHSFDKVKLTCELDIQVRPDHIKKFIEMSEKYIGVRLDSREKVESYTEARLADALALGATTNVWWIKPGQVTTEIEEKHIDSAYEKLSQKENWTPEEFAAVNTAFFKRKLDFAREHGQTFQLCLSSQVIPGYRYSVPVFDPAYLQIVCSWINRYPEVTFDIMNCDNNAEPFLTAFAKTTPGVNLSGTWWHMMSEGWIEEILYRRLLSVPIHKQCAFFTDAYVCEWMYGKYILKRAGLCKALSRTVEQGYFSLAEAKEYLKLMLYDNPKRIYRL